MTIIKNKTAAWLLSVALAAAMLLTACGRKSAGDDAAQTASAAASTAEASSAAEAPSANEAAAEDTAVPEASSTTEASSAAAEQETETDEAADSTAGSSSGSEAADVPEASADPAGGADESDARGGSGESAEQAAADDGFVLTDIVCWGDSLTVGGNVSYPAVLDSLLPETVTVHNVSDRAGGENAITITCRSGAMNFVVREDFYVPQPGEEVPFSFCAETGQWVNPNRRNLEATWRARVGDVWGAIRLMQDTPPDLLYGFTAEEGQQYESFTVPAGTPIYLGQYDEYAALKDAYPIIMIGQNSGFNGVEDLIRQQKAIIDTYGDGEHYLVLGFPAYALDDRRSLYFATESGDLETVELIKKNRDALEAALKETFGDRFLNVREYLCTRAMEDLGMTPTAEDTEQMSSGTVPQSLRREGDEVHLNDSGYTALGRAVYERMAALGDI